MTGSPVLNELWIYPIKSCAGIEVEELTLEKQGPRYDRQWMIVDDSGIFLSQRKLPKMARIKTALTPGGLRLFLGDDRAENTLEISLTEEFAPRPVQVWSSEVLAHVESEIVNHKISDFLGQKVSLVRHGSRSHRQVKKAGVSFGAEVRFADGFPLLLTNLKSLEALNSHLKTRIPMSRFRSNLVIDFGEAYVEDQWKALRTNSGLELEFAKPCARCVIITIDQTTGLPQGPEPTALLNQMRKGRALGEGYEEKGVYFGMNLVHRGTGRLVRGEKLEIRS
jgi:uncharacterized protein YcbX